MVLALGKRWGLSRISGSLGTQSMSRLEAVRSSSGAPMALWSVQDVSEVDLAPGKRWGLSRNPGSLGTGSVTCLEAV